MFRAKRVMSAVATCAALGASGGLTATAQADATGYSGFKPITIPGTPIETIPTGTIEHTIKGEGLFIRTQRAGFTAAAPLCNTEMKFELSHRGNAYSSYTTALNSGCTVTKWFPTHTWNKTGQTGKACAILYTDGTEISRQCHNVTT